MKYQYNDERMLIVGVSLLVFSIIGGVILFLKGGL